MSDSPMQRKPLFPHEIPAMYARLSPQDVEQFYTAYQLWTLTQQIDRLQAELSTLQQQLAEHRQRMQQAQPPSIALVALAHLQAHGVNDNELLNRMLARGEDWLEQTMQYLVYCEEINVIRDNYTEWCQHALEGAYDWLGSMQHDGTAISTSETPSMAEANTLDRSSALSLDEATEEILLQKLLSDEPEEDEEALLATTLKRPRISPPVARTLAAPSEQVIEEEQLQPIGGEAGAGEHIEPEVEPVAQEPGELAAEPILSEYSIEGSSAPISYQEPDKLALEEVIVAESHETAPAGSAGEDVSPSPEMVEVARPTEQDTYEARGSQEPKDRRQDNSIIIIERKRSFLRWLFSLFLRR